MLQQERILFSPPLPADKRAAISRIKMSNAVKVSLLVYCTISLLFKERKIGEAESDLV